MIQFSHMDPINPIAGNPEALNSASKNKNSSNGLVTVLSFAVFVLLALGTIVFLFNQNQTLKKQIAGYQSSPTSTPTLTSSPTPSADLPVVSSPSANSKVKSPLKVAGEVPAGWMFEGVFPIKLLDLEKNIIAQTNAKEIVAGSWQTGEPVEFSATLTFKAATGSGTLVLENDNPSGDPENARSLEIPVTFSGSSVCTLEAKICPDGSSVGRTGPNCEFATCP